MKRAFLKVIASLVGYGFGLTLGLLSFIIVLANIQGCLLDTSGFCDPNDPPNPNCSQTGGSGGGDTSSSTGGTGGGTGGSTTSSSSSTSTGGQGGSGGDTTSSSSSSGGSGGMGGAGGSGGSGGSGGGDPVVPTCDAGAPGTVDSITASGAISTGLLIHFQGGSEFYSTATPTMKSITGEILPAQMVLYGQDGIQFDLKNGAAGVPQVFYKVDFASLPAACGGANLKSQACLTLVAKAFRCQFAPYLESSSCPAPVGFTQQPAASFYQDATQGHKMLLVHLACQ